MWAISPFLALRLGDLARAAGLRAGDFARAGDLARPRGFGAGEAARARVHLAVVVDGELAGENDGERPQVQVPRQAQAHAAREPVPRREAADGGGDEHVDVGHVVGGDGADGGGVVDLEEAGKGFIYRSTNYSCPQRFQERRNSLAYRYLSCLEFVWDGNL